jgi:prepilin-type N-terminal cleavage/methylation domain-containing protein
MISKLLKKNEKGFTLMEMLIVVAIIAVLVAIAIPTFNASLTKAKQAADVANIRAYYALKQVDAITNSTSAKPDSSVTDGTTLAAKMKTDGYALNIPANLTYDSSSGKVTYTADKLTGGNGADATTYEWSFGDNTAS